MASCLAPFSADNAYERLFSALWRIGVVAIGALVPDSAVSTMDEELSVIALGKMLAKSNCFRLGLCNAIRSICSACLGLPRSVGSSSNMHASCHFDPFAELSV